MKKIYIIVVLVASLFASSCHGDLDIIPQTYSTEEDRDRLNEDNPDLLLSASINSLYRGMVLGAHAGEQSTYGQNGVDYILSSMGNDVAMGRTLVTGWFDYTIQYRGEIYTRCDFFWRYFYGTITDANNLIKLLPEEGTPHTPLQTMARATALSFRGYAYFYLANIFQFAYSDATKNLPGVPIITGNTTEDQPRATLEETYTQAINDLKAAQKIFTDAGQVKRKPIEHDATSCAIYLTRAYLAMGDFVNAEKQTDIVIANYRVLKGRDELWQGFSTIIAPNVVLGFENTVPIRLSYASKWAQLDPYALKYAINVVKYGFNGLIEQIDENDDRFFWWLSPEATEALEGPGKGFLLRDTPYEATQVFFAHEMGGQAKYMSVKFIGTGRSVILGDPYLNNGIGTRDWDLGDNIYLRSEEAYINKAEALAHQGRLGEAITALETFVQTRNATYTCPVSSKEDLITEIQLHKRIEFWYEGMEYLDNRRLNVPIDRRNKPGFVSNHYSTGKLFMQQNDIKFLFQLPLTEIENSTALTHEDQNP